MGEGNVGEGSEGDEWYLHDVDVVVGANVLGNESHNSNMGPGGSPGNCIGSFISAAGCLDGGASAIECLQLCVRDMVSRALPKLEERGLGVDLRRFLSLFPAPRECVVPGPATSLADQSSHPKVASTNCFTCMPEAICAHSIPGICLSVSTCQGCIFLISML